MSKAEERALSAYPPEYGDEDFDKTWDSNEQYREPYQEGYEQAEKDIIVEVEKWLKANFHHRNCWNADEFCVSLRTYFGIEK